MVAHFTMRSKDRSVNENSNEDIGNLEEGDLSIKMTTFRFFNGIWDF